MVATELILSGQSIISTLKQIAVRKVLVVKNQATKDGAQICHYE